MRALTVVVPALTGAAYLVAPGAITLVLPKFLPGVTAARVLCFGAGGITLANLSSIVLMTLGRQNVLVPVAVGMTALGAGLDYLAVRSGFGIDGVARMTLLTYFMNGGVLLWLACDGLRIAGSDRARLLARALVPFLLGFVLAYAIDKALPWPVGMPRSLQLLRILAALGLFAAFYGAAVSPLVRGLGLLQLVREMNPMQPGAARRGEPEIDPKVEP